MNAQFRRDTFFNKSSLIFYSKMLQQKVLFSEVIQKENL